jgi:hypothetical protein
VFLSSVFYPRLGNENLVPVWNLNPSLVFVHQECGLLFAQGYVTQHNLVKVILQSISLFFFAATFMKQANNTRLQ